MGYLKSYAFSLREGKPERAMGIALCAMVLLSGCGYSLQQRLKDGFTNAQGIFVPVFSNSTDEIGAERVFTNALIRELQSRGEVLITQRRAGAYELRGVVDRISYYPSALTAPGFKGLQPYRRLPSELVVEVGVSLRLVDPANDKTLWSGAFSGFRRLAAPLSRTFDFEAPSSVALAQQSLIESQYSPIARDIMRDVYDSMVELF